MSRTSRTSSRFADLLETKAAPGGDGGYSQPEAAHSSAYSSLVMTGEGDS